MAPKGIKRPASFDAEVSKVKKALTAGNSGAAMLAGMCKATLTVPKEERHTFQTSVVGMIEEALGAMEVDYKSSCDSLKATVDGCPSDKVSRAAAVVDAEKELVGLKEAVKASKEGLGVATKGLDEAAAALATAKKEQKKGDAVLTALEAKKGKIAAVQTDSLAPMGEEGAKADSKALKAVQKMGKELQLDHSLLMVVPELAKKPKEARSAFEDTSYQSIVAEFTKHVDALAAQIAEGEPAKKARAEAVAAAEAAHQAADKAKADAEAAVEAAKAAEKAGAAALKTAERRVASWLADSKKAMDAYDDAVVQGKEFASVLATFAELKELAPPPPPVEEPVEEPPPAEAPPAQDAQEAAVAA